MSQVLSVASAIDRHRECHSSLFVLINLGIRTMMFSFHKQIVFASLPT